MKVSSDHGVFSGGRLDKGTAILLDSVPPPPAQGDFLDLGCGWGPIALSLASASPQARVHAIDVNERARQLTAANAKDLGLSNIAVSEPDAVAARQFDLIWSNPPIRIGKEPARALLKRWIERLAPSGTAYLVISKNLGGDSYHRFLAEDLGMQVERIRSQSGFRVLEVSPPPS